MDERIKTLIEEVHIDYLCKTFKLVKGEQSQLELDKLRPDLIGIEPEPTQKPQSIFELKIRTYQQNQRNRPKSDYKWWRVWQEQIEGYEQIAEKNKVEMYWIFLLGTTTASPTELKTVDENSFQDREIWVAPWDAYQHCSLAPRECRNIGLSRLKANYKFTEHQNENHTLNIATTIEDKINKYFI